MSPYITIKINREYRFRFPQEAICYVQADKLRASVWETGGWKRQGWMVSLYHPRLSALSPPPHLQKPRPFAYGLPPQLMKWLFLLFPSSSKAQRSVNWLIGSLSFSSPDLLSPFSFIHLLDSFQNYQWVPKCTGMLSQKLRGEVVSFELTSQINR